MVYKPVLTSAAAIRIWCPSKCGSALYWLIMWMHTFSPARMWIAGLNMLRKPYVHLHTSSAGIFLV